MLDTALPASNHALQQDPAFLSALRLCGQNPVTLPSGLTVLSRRIFGIRVAMLPRAMPPADLRPQLKSVGLARVPLILSPERRCPNMRALRLRKPMTTAAIDLTLNKVARRSRLHAKWRNQLCSAEDGPLKVRSAAMQPDHPVLQIEEDQARTRGYVNWPRTLTSAFAQAARDQTRLFTAYLRGTPVSHMLFLLHGGRATYHIGYSTYEGRSYHAHNLLLWNASCWLADLGYTSLDLGLLHEKTHTLNRFKLRAGAKAHSTGGTWLRWHPLARSTT